MFGRWLSFSFRADFQVPAVCLRGSIRVLILGAKWWWGWGWLWWWWWWWWWWCWWWWWWWWWWWSWWWWWWWWWCWWLLITRKICSQVQKQSKIWLYSECCTKCTDVQILFDNPGVAKQIKHQLPPFEFLFFNILCFARKNPEAGHTFPRQPRNASNQMSFVQYWIAFGWRLQLCWTKTHLDGRGGVMERAFPYPVLGSSEMLVVTPKFDSCMYWILNMHGNYYCKYKCIQILYNSMILNSNFWYRWGSHLPSLLDGDLCDLRDVFFFFVGSFSQQVRGPIESRMQIGQLLGALALFGQFSRPQNRSKIQKVNIFISTFWGKPPESAPTKIPPKSKVQNCLWHIMRIQLPSVILWHV